MTTGKQLAALLLLTTAMTVPGTVLAQGTTGAPGTGAEGAVAVETQADADIAGDPQSEATPDDEAAAEPDISVPGNTIIVTGRVNRDPTRNSTQVISVLSTEQIARTGEGDIAGALGRVTGLTVQGQGFVYVRGLGDRYSLALLNGLPLPSPQPLSRVVPLDIFPTSVVASSLVQKTYSANYPGEFGGGVINLTTRAVPEESFVTISGGISGDTETSLQDGLTYFGSDSDWTGFDSGRRDIPETLRDFYASGSRVSDLDIDQQELAKALTVPNLMILQKMNAVPVNFSAGITAGTAMDVFDDGRLGIVATAGISNKWRTRSITAQSVLADFSLDSDSLKVVSDNRVLVNGLLGFGLEVGEHKFRFTNLFIRDTLKQAGFGLVEDFQDDDSRQTQSTGWFERQLFDSQFVGELEFGRLSLDLRGGFAQTRREAPFEYDFTYVRANDSSTFGDYFINTLDRQTGDATVVFSDLKEELWFGGVDLSYEVTDWLNASVGYAYSDTDRYSERREFLFNASTAFDDAVGFLRPDLLLGDAVIDYYEIGLFESTQSDPAFEAELLIHAGYLQAQLLPAEGITIDLGVRYEDAEQRVDPAEVFATATNSGSSTLIANDYFLPAGTITWEVSDGLQLRASASRTIARPQFRELIFQTYYDPETNRQFNGNPFLVDSELINLELRGEYYLSAGSRASLAGFYKEIDNPIEAYSSFSDNEQLTGFANAPRAQLYGAELELQYNYDLFDLGGVFENRELVAIANYTYTKSEISVSEDDTTQVFPSGTASASDFFIDGVALTGQSDHLVNLQLGIENIERLEQLTILLSYASERVTSRGTSGLPDIVEDPGLRLDIVARRGIDLFGFESELKVEARNILGRDHEEFQTNGTDRVEINTYDVGTSFSASLSVTF